jgi:hypothetical protein
MKSTLYSFDLKDIHLNTVSGFTEKSIKYIDGTDKVEVKIGGVDINMEVNAELRALKYIPFEASHVNVTNLTIEFVVESTADDQVHWKIVETSQVNIGKVDIQMKSSFLNWLVKVSSSVINTVIQDMLPKIGGVVDAEVEKINKMVANEGPYTFVVPALGKQFPLNLTMSTAPKLEKGSNLIQVLMDGLFDIPEGQEVHSKYKVEVNHEYPPRFAHSHSEQFYIHESTLNSLMKVADESFFPYMVTSKNITSQLGQMMPEIAEYYGKGVEIALGLSFMANNTAAPISFNATHGIVIGDMDGVLTKLDLICSNATTTNETAVEFALNLETHVNMTMKDLVFFPTVEDIRVANTVIKRDLIGLYARNWDQTFSNILQNAVNDFNTQYVKGWALASLDPRLAMITGLIKNSTMTPYIADKWMYAGFSMQADLPTMTGVQELEFIQ